jgi:hypothetical protein
MEKKIDKAIAILRKLQFKPGLDSREVEGIERVIETIQQLEEQIRV